MIDSALIFFDNVVVTTNITSPTFNFGPLANIEKYRWGRPLRLKMQYTAGLFPNRVYQLVAEQSAYNTFAIIPWSLNVVIGDPLGYFSDAFVGKELTLACVPIHWQFIRARFVLSGSTPRSLTVAKCYLTVS